MRMKEQARPHTEVENAWLADESIWSGPAKATVGRTLNSKKSTAG